MLIIVIVTESQCTHGDVQLVGGSGSYEGNVQICNKGVWGWVCDNSWSFNDARVVCRQLGFSTTSLWLLLHTLPIINNYYYYRCLQKILFFLWIW